MAASTSFKATIVGKGGHAAMPHLTIDPVVAAAAVVQALQPIVSRETNPADSAVISITQLNTGSCFPPGAGTLVKVLYAMGRMPLFHAGIVGKGATNVIPDSVGFGGTLRSLSERAAAQLIERATKVMQGS